jgi:hypothetical protein
VLGFFGLGTGYLIFGPQELFGWPSRDRSVDRATGVWGIWMPGFCQFLTGVYLFVGLTWIPVFHDTALYMAALAFSAYGIHWFAVGWNRFQESDDRIQGPMAIAFIVLSVLGMVVFFHAGSWPLGVLFAGLTAVYICEFLANVPFGVRSQPAPAVTRHGTATGNSGRSGPGAAEAGVALAGSLSAEAKTSRPVNVGLRGLGFFHLLTGAWLMYLTFATTLDIAAGFHLPGA